MELNKENSLHLYHYCSEITDALRPILNTPDLPINNEYWFDTLLRFRTLIDGILGEKSVEFTKLFTTILNGLLSNPVFTPSKKEIGETITLAYNSALAVIDDLKKRGLI